MSQVSELNFLVSFLVKIAYTFLLLILLPSNFGYTCGVFIGKETEFRP